MSALLQTQASLPLVCGVLQKAGASWRRQENTGGHAFRLRAKTLWQPLSSLQSICQHPTLFKDEHLVGARRSNGTVMANTAGGPGQQAAGQFTTAKDAVEKGLALFQKNRVREALTCFDRALELSPTPEEAQAALYNKACCHAQREEMDRTAKALKEALSKYGLRFSVVLNDPDMAPFRATKAFKQLRDEAAGGQGAGQSYRKDLKLISEVQAPFRGVRMFAYIAFGIAAGIAIFFNVPRVIKAVQGGEDAPPLQGELVNLGVDVGGVAGFSALYLWEKKKEEEQIDRINRDETLSRLPVRLQTGKVVELFQLRETTRPVVVVGNKAAVEKAVRSAERYRKDLLDRGVLVVPLVWGQGKEDELSKPKGFAGTTRRKAPEPVDIDEFAQRAAAVAQKAVIEGDKKFKAEAVSPGAWERWVKDQQKATKGVNIGEDVYIVLRLDGRVRGSGKGAPDWEKLVEELPTLDNLVSKLEK